MSVHLAQLNLARLRAPLDDPLMADFVADLPALNALADGSPGFVWRLRDEDGEGTDATGLRPFGPELLVNLSVWESVPALRDYVYRSPHLEALRRRREWFVHDRVTPHLVLWWVPAGHLPTLDEARKRRDLLIRSGPGPDAFTLRQVFPAPDSAVPAPGPGSPASDSAVPALRS